MKVFSLLVIALAILRFMTEYFLISDELIYDSLINQLSYERISEMLNQGKEWQWLSYVFLPILVFVKILFVVACFSIGALFLDIENGFKKFYTIAVNAEFVFIAPGLIKLFWFSFLKIDYTLLDLRNFSPLSMFSFFNQTELDPWLVYPLQLLNAFELLYWVVLAYQLQKVLGESLSGSIGFVSKTYGAGLFIWVIFVMFLIVSIS
jgi:hypothetical protein